MTTLLGKPVPQTPLPLPPKLARRGRKPLIPRVLTPREAAAILRVSEDTIKKYLLKGRVHGFRTGVYEGGPWRTTDLAVMAFMDLPVPGFPMLAPLPHPSGRGSRLDATGRDYHKGAIAKRDRSRAAGLRRLNLVVGVTSATGDEATWEGKRPGGQEHAGS